MTCSVSLASLVLGGALGCTLSRLAKALYFGGRHKAPSDTWSRCDIRQGCRQSYLLAHDSIAELIGHLVRSVDAGHCRAGQRWVWVVGEGRKRCVLLECRALLATAWQ